MVIRADASHLEGKIPFSKRCHLNVLVLLQDMTHGRMRILETTILVSLNVCLMSRT